MQILVTIIDNDSIIFEVETSFKQEYIPDNSKESSVYPQILKVGHYMQGFFVI